MGGGGRLGGQEVFGLREAIQNRPFSKTISFGEIDNTKASGGYKKTASVRVISLKLFTGGYSLPRGHQR